METKTNWLSWRMWGLCGLVWAAYACMHVFVLFLGQAYAGSGRLQFEAQLLAFLISFLPLAVATPPLFHLCQWAVLRDMAPRRLWRLSAAVVVGTAAVHSTWSTLWFSPPLELLVSGVLGSMMTHVFHYGVVVGLAVAVSQRQLAQTRQRELLDAQLRALRAQLQPHFLFNTLHAISVTGRTDANAATRMITLLGDLLRQTLRERDGQFVSLAEEQDLLQPYLELQKLRFPDRLRIEVDFPADVLGAAVPDLLLQPLVENALEHGIAQRPEGGTVRIAARRWGERLEIQVRDDGACPGSAPREAGLGIGLPTTRARLQALFGARAEVTLAETPGGGTTARLVLPYREVAHAA